MSTGVGRLCPPPGDSPTQGRNSRLLQTEQTNPYAVTKAFFPSHSSRGYRKGVLPPDTSYPGAVGPFRSAVRKQHRAVWGRHASVLTESLSGTYGTLLGCRHAPRGREMGTTLGGKVEPVMSKSTLMQLHADRLGSPAQKAR